MPYINFKTNQKLDESTKIQLKAELGRAIATIPGKSETYLMVAIEDSVDMWLGGDQKPLAMIDVKIYGHAKPADFSRMTGELCKISKSLVGIDPTGVYATYEEIDNWGWNGKNF